MVTPRTAGRYPLDMLRDVAPRTLAELAGLPLENPLVRPTAWEVPTRVELADGKLTWAYLGNEEAWLASPTWPSPPSARPGPGMLQRFVELASDRATDEAIRRFAARWGVLTLCEHLLPHTHPPLRTDPRGSQFCERLPTVAGDAFTGSEPVELWRIYAAWASTVLAAAAGWHSNRAFSVAPTSPGLDDRGIIAFGEAARGDAAAARVDRAVNLWLQLGGVRPWSSISQDPAVRLGGVSLFGALAVELMLVVSRTEGIAFCSACGSPFLPARRPAANRRTYCEDCRKEGASRNDASRAWRARHPEYFKQRWPRRKER